MRESGEAVLPWSCDTYVARADATRAGRVIFGKNSDRPAGEAQPLRFVPARPAAGRLDLAYVSVPDQPAHAHLGAAPFWCWGYEFGVNEHNVVIGNEAQFTRSWAENVARAGQGSPPEPGVIGMELVRLGLERGATADEALTVMTRILEEYGQWGAGKFGVSRAEGAYDNSYVIADSTDAWVLETSGREWVAKRVERGTYAISNEPSIRTEFDRASAGLIEAARRRGWSPKEGEFDYARSHVDPGTPLQVSHMRQRRAQSMLTRAQDSGGLDLPGAKEILRDHFEDTFLAGPFFNAACPDFLTLCMHEHAAGFTWGNTAGSLIVEIGRDPDEPTVIWWTPLPPCVGAYIPLFLQSAAVPDTLSRPEPPARVRPPEEHGQAPYMADSYWWRAQNLLDATKGDAEGTRFTERQAVVRARFDRLELGWAREADRLRESWRHANAARRAELVEAMRTLTAEAVAAVDAEVATLLGEFAPGAGTGPLDPRWSAEPTARRPG